MSERKISTYYEADHDRLDDLFRSFQRLKRSDFSRAQEYSRQFTSGILRHIVWEENILFPLFERKTGNIDHGPTAVMRMEHKMIQAYLETIHAGLRDGNTETEADEERLLNTLFMHNGKEERILYPAIDELLDEKERESVFVAMKETSGM